MVRPLVKFLLSLGAALCVPIALFCVWGFASQREPGQEVWLVLFPSIFAEALWSVRYRLSRRHEFDK